MNDDLTELHMITQARYQKAQVAMQVVQSEENRLRGLLLELVEKEKSGRLVMAQDSTLRMTGGDVAWNSWIGRNRKILNQQLANVLVRKEHAFHELKAHFGKADVLEKMVHDQRATRRKTRQMAQVNAALEVGLITY